MNIITEGYLYFRSDDELFRWGIIIFSCVIAFICMNIAAIISNTFKKFILSFLTMIITSGIISCAFLYSIRHYADDYIQTMPTRIEMIERVYETKGKASKVRLNDDEIYFITTEFKPETGDIVEMKIIKDRIIKIKKYRG